MSHKRSVYLEDLPMEEAIARLKAALEEAGLSGPLPGERVPLVEALGRVTAEPVWAAISVPHYHASAMDGYAVRARDTLGASETNPVTLTLIADDADADRVERPARPLNTGQPLPAWADAVIMIEHVQEASPLSPQPPPPSPRVERGEGESEGVGGEAQVEALIIRSSVAPWQHVRPMGEDMVATELVLPANHVLRPVDLGALAGSGHATVSVRRRPRVAIIPTGSELVSLEDVGAMGEQGSSGLPLPGPGPGRIIEYNSLVLAAQIESWGGTPTRWPIIPDEFEAIQTAIREAAQQHDLVLVNAGSSAGSEDFTAQAIAAQGEVLVHGVAVRPGHPVILGMVVGASPPTPFGSPSPLSTRGEGGGGWEEGGEAQRPHTPRTGKLWGKLKPLARQKRHAPTPSEEKLWQALRNRQVGGHKFRRQHAIERFIVDFYCPKCGLIVEVDGPIYEYTAEEDAIRQEYLESLGMAVLRVTSEEVMSDLDSVLSRVLAEVEPHPRRATPDSPSPRVERGPGGEAVPVIGVPGYPVSAALTGEIFIQPLIRRWLGQPPAEPPTIQATLSRKITSPPGDDDFVRVAVGQVGEKVIATPLSRGAGVITSLVRADGLVRIPRFSEGLDAGTAVTVRLIRSPAEIARTIVAIGSHDMTLDLLAQFLAERAPGYRLSSANVGSLGGLVALRRGEAHLAGSHLLDPDTGEYNWKYIDQYLAGRDVVLITLVHREQGLIVPPGNPLGIGGFEDLARPDVRFVNRQRGAGTRLLLDYELGKRGIDPASVQGYEREEYTHLAVAAAVSSGAADCGLGVRAAARALRLDFVPVGWERYDLVIPREHAESPLLAPLLALLRDAAFRAAVAALEGYDVTPMGESVQREIR